MKKTFIYIIAGVIVIAILALVLSQQQKQEFDKRVTLGRQYKDPYGLEVVYTHLPMLFNNGKIKINRDPPNYWYDPDSALDGKTIFFAVTQHFDPNRSEMHQLLNFVKKGNIAFISTPDMDDDAKQYFALGEEGFFNFKLYNYFKDSGTTYLSNPPFTKDTSFLTPGYSYTTHFIDVDSLHYYILSRNENGYPDLVKVDAGKGSFYLHSNPLFFSNYSLLWHNNLNYLEKIASLMPADKNKIIWDEYYMYRLKDNERNNPGNASALHVLFNTPAFRWAFILGIALLLVYILLGAKLMQRLVPVWDKPKNESLDFTKTIGRLYFEKGDHTNLAKKMATYLLDYVRNKYFVSTATLNDEFVNNLLNKSGYDEEETKKVVEYIIYIQAGNKINEQKLAEIYQTFSKFYKHTS
ncbi:MAG TPA: DUF4350 domain-containing protein [Chitinophagaceae bacterium]|nr:DUF4350 domain-containing protein [Chitinophagaceae bacterium]